MAFVAVLPRPPCRRAHAVASATSLSHAIRARTTTAIPPLVARQLSSRALTPATWRAAVDACRSDPDALAHVLRSALHASIADHLHVAHFVRPLRALASARRWGRVHALLRDMAVVGPPVAPDDRLVIGLANLAVDRGAYAHALALFDFMRQQNLALGPVAYSVLLKAHGRAANIVAVKAVLAEIDHRTLSYDSVLLNSAVDALVRCSDLLAASRLLNDDAHAPLRDVATYNTIIKGFAQRGLVDDAFDTAHRMREAGQPPNAVTRNTLLTACVNAGDFERAWPMINTDTARSTPVGPAESAQLTIALTSLVAGLADAGRISDAVHLLADMKTRHAPPSAITYAALLNACFRHGAVEDAVRVFRDIPQDLHTLDVCNAYVTGLCRVGQLARVEEAARLVEGLLSGPVRPNQATFNALLDGFTRCGEFERAEQYIHYMEERADVRPGIVSFTILMKGFGDARQFGTAKRMFREISQRGLKPDRVALNAFVSVCARSGDCRAAERVLEYMEREGGAISPSAYSYAPLITAYARRSMDDEVWKTYDRMRSNGIPITDFLCEALCMYVASSKNQEHGARRAAAILRDGRADGVSAKVLSKWRRKLVRVFQAAKAKRHLRGLDSPEFRSASETIFERHGWNEIDSGWRVI